MSKKGALYIELVKQMKEPSEAHLKIRSILKGNASTTDFHEFYVIEGKGDFRLVNFYSDKEAIAIELSKNSEDESFGEVKILKINENLIFDPTHKAIIEKRIAQSITGGRSPKEINTSEIIAEPIIKDSSESPSIAEVEYRPAPESISEIIGNPPGWLLRSGITILAVVTMMILGMSHLISYPDKLIANGYITTDVPPIAIISQSQSIIESLYVSDGQHITEGEDILLLRSTAEKSDIEHFVNWMSSLDRDQFKGLKEGLNLGPIQGNYAQLLLLLSEYQEINGQQSSYQQINTIDEELSNIRELNKTIDIENLHYETEQKIASSALARSRQLYAEGVISKVDLEQDERSYEQFARQLQNTTKSKVQNDIRVVQLNFEIQKITEQRIGELRNYRFRINQLITTISEQIDRWYQNYVITAEIDGTVELAGNIDSKLAITPGTHIAYIVPIESSDIKVVKSQLPIAGSGKITKGAKSIIKLHNYPYKEYGVIITEINNISQVPTITESGEYYDATMNLPSTLITDYNHSIPYKPNMTAIVEIITEDKSILMRITEQLRSLFN